MSDLSRAIPFTDDISPVFEALSRLCREEKVSPDSIEGATIASCLFDLLQKGATTTDALVTAFRHART